MQQRNTKRKKTIHPHPTHCTADQERRADPLRVCLIDHGDHVHVCYPLASCTRWHHVTTHSAHSTHSTHQPSPLTHQPTNPSTQPSLYHPFSAPPPTTTHFPPLPLAKLHHHSVPRAPPSKSLDSPARGHACTPSQPQQFIQPFISPNIPLMPHLNNLTPIT